jgi:hypothetical protein
MKIIQEFYCNECVGYFRVTLDVGFNRLVGVECPNCGHQHEREIKDGIIYENHKTGSFHEILMPMKSTYSKTAALRKSEKGMRNGLPLGDPEKDLIQERWNEIFGDRI